MSRKRKIVRILKKIATAILAVIMFASLAAGLFMGILNKTADDSISVSLKISDFGYSDKVYDAIYDSLERKMALVVISPEDISDIITKSVINEEAHKGAASLTDCIFGKEGVEYAYENDALFERIRTLLETYAAENHIEFEEGSAEAVYEMVCDTVTAEVRVLSPIYTEKLYTYTSKAVPMLELWWIPFAVWVLCGAGIVLLGLPHKRRTLYNILLPTYLGAFAVFAASVILYYKDYLGHTVLGGGALMPYMQGLYRAVLGNMWQSSLVISSILFAAGMLASIILSAVKRKKK